jgi:hypothetical protein
MKNPYLIYYGIKNSNGIMQGSFLLKTVLLSLKYINKIKRCVESTKMRGKIEILII